MGVWYRVQCRALVSALYQMLHLSCNHNETVEEVRIIGILEEKYCCKQRSYRAYS